MTLYVNGDSHSAGAEAMNPHAFAEDDPLYYGLGRQPHPDNLSVSYGCELANMLYTILHCDAESASSNSRIIRSTIDYLKEYTPELVIIGWSTWEREEWLHEGTYWQVNAGGVGHDWPDAIKEKYKNWILGVDYQESMRQAHGEIWELHRTLISMDVKHLFFNTFEPFSNLPEFSWGNSYIKPYDPESTYYNWLIKNGFKTVRPDSYHFGPDAHRAWANFLYQNHVQNILTNLE